MRKKELVEIRTAVNNRKDIRIYLSDNKDKCEFIFALAWGFIADLLGTFQPLEKDSLFDIPLGPFVVRTEEKVKSLFDSEDDIFGDLLFLPEKKYHHDKSINFKEACAVISEFIKKDIVSLKECTRLKCIVEMELFLGPEAEYETYTIKSWPENELSRYFEQYFKPYVTDEMYDSRFLSNYSAKISSEIKILERKEREKKIILEKKRAEDYKNELAKQEEIKKGEIRKGEEIRNEEIRKKEEHRLSEMKDKLANEARAPQHQLDKKRQEVIANKIEEKRLIAFKSQQTDSQIEKNNLLLQKEIANYDVKINDVNQYLINSSGINYQNPTNGYTALMIAVDAQNDRIAEYLLNLGANPLIQNSYGSIASDLASCNSFIFPLLKKREKELLRENLPIAEKFSILLQEYVTKSNANALKIDEYLTCGADINHQNSDGLTALMLAANALNEHTTEYLLSIGANPFLKNTKGKTVKHFASRNSHLFAIIKGYELLFATMNNDKTTISSLLKADNNIIDFQGSYGYTALLIAIEGNMEEMVACLLLYGANMAISLDDGRGVDDLVNNVHMKRLLSEWMDKIENNSHNSEEKNHRYNFFDTNQNPLQKTIFQTSSHT